MDEMKVASANRMYLGLIMIGGWRYGDYGGFRNYKSYKAIKAIKAIKPIEAKEATFLIRKPPLIMNVYYEREPAMRMRTRSPRMA